MPDRPQRSEPALHVAIVMNTLSGVKTLRSDLIDFLLSRGHRVTAISKIDVPPTDLPHRGVSLIHWELYNAGMNPVRELLSIIRLRRILSGLMPDVTLNFTPKAVLYGSLAARRLRGCTIFSVLSGLGFLFTDTTPNSPANAIWTFFFRLALRTNPVVFFHNPDDQDLFIRKRIVPRSRTFRVFGSGVDTTKFSPAVRRKPNPHTTFLMVARLLTHKGVLDYLAAATILKRRNRPARCKLLGPFYRHPTAIDPATLKSYTDSGVVEYLGTVSDVRPHIAAADVFVLPSYREGTPRATLEAMAMAKPIITTDSPGCRETVREGINGYMVPVRDPASLASAMAKLIDRPLKIIEMGAHSRRIAERLYDVRAVNQAMWTRILQALDSRPRCPRTRSPQPQI